MAITVFPGAIFVEIGHEGTTFEEIAFGEIALEEVVSGGIIRAGIAFEGTDAADDDFVDFFPLADLGYL